MWYHPFLTDSYTDILLIVFIFITSVQLFWYLFFFVRLAFYKKKNTSTAKEPVSVVICARNEYENLKKNLPLILEQDYPDYEVVVVNDGSDDDSDFLLHSLSKTYPRLKIVTIRENVNFFSGKKFPLSIGIKSAKNDILLLTDADCIPESDQWITNMQSNYTKGVEIVLGYGRYEKEKGLLNILIRFDTIHIAIQYLSFALAGTAYMGVGRNLSYRKKMFYAKNGFQSHYKLKSGDDDLFINHAATSKNVRIEISRESCTESEPKKNFPEWYAQKKRHFSTSNYYMFRHKFLLSLYYISQLLFYILAIWTACNLQNLIIVISLIVIRTAVQYFIFFNCMKKLNEKLLLVTLPLLEMILLIMNPFISLANLVNKENKWK